MFWKKKKSPFEFKCSQCGEFHKDWPAIAYDAPWQYHTLTEQEKDEIAHLRSDMCIINWDDQTDRFIRTVLQMPVNDFELTLEYGVWVSVSEQSFKNYDENFDRTDYEAGCFGWLCSKLEGYKDTLQIPTDVIINAGSQRPILQLHKNHEHPLVADFYQGISKEEAEHRIHQIMKQNTG